VPRVRLGGPGVPVERVNPHPAHQGGHVLAPHGHAVEAYVTVHHFEASSKEMIDDTCY